MQVPDPSSGVQTMASGRTAEKRERAPRSQHPVRLGDPHVGIAPDRGAVLGERHVEGFVGVGDRLRVPVDQGQLDVVLGREAAGGVELSFGVVDTDDLGASSSHPPRPVRGAAPELDRVEAGHVVGEEIDFGVRDLPHPPVGSLLGPGALAAGHPLVGHAVPESTVLGHVLLERLVHGASLADRGVRNVRDIVDTRDGADATDSDGVCGDGGGGRVRCHGLWRLGRLE